MIGGGLALAASVVAAVMLLSQFVTEAPMVATVVNVLGNPETGARGHAMMALRVSDQLQAGSVLETDGDGGVALQLITGHSLRLAPATRVRIEVDSVVLDAGAVYLDSGEDKRVTPIEVRSRVATVRELGTQYMVRLTRNSLEVSVREGEVRVAQGDSAGSAIAGEMLQLFESGHTEKSSILEYGEHWTWVTELSPVPVLDELTLAQFLRWLTREHGWQLEFASPELDRYAGMVELYGSIDGLSGEEALEVVMIAAGWRYRLTEGTLTVDSRADDDK